MSNCRIWKSGSQSDSDDTDVMVFGKSGNQTRTRHINTSNILNSLGNSVSAALPRLHAFTGCDTVSAFAGKGKLPTLKILNSKGRY